MRRWLWSCPVGLSGSAIQQRLGFAHEPVSELMCANWADKAVMMVELSAAFVMPNDFGHNWDAVDECLLDLCSAGRLIIIRDIAPDAHPNVARLVDCVRGMWRQEERFHPKGRVAVVLEGWDAPSITATWQGETSPTYKVAHLTT